MPTGDPLTSGLTFRNFVLYEGNDIPPPPSAPKAAAILDWQDNAISANVPFTLVSLQVFCPPPFCNITLRASATDAAGVRQQTGSGWFTFDDTNSPASFALAVTDRQGLGGYVGSFEDIDLVEITADFAGDLRVALFDDVIISRNCAA